MKIKARGFAAQHSFTRLKPITFERDTPKANEVHIAVTHCGVCHSDIHQVKNHWLNTVYPCMPGHEVVGKVVSVGAQVTKHKVGDRVGVGCMIDSCGRCDACKSGEQNYCEGPNSWLATYNGPMVPAKEAKNENIYGRNNTFGGYSDCLVVPQDFVLKIPDGMPSELAAPLLCAGVTTYSPLKHWGVKKGDKIGVVGFGGLGHVAAKLARAMGADVTVLTKTEEKIALGSKLGFDVVHEKDKERLSRLEGMFDFMLDTIPSPHSVNAYVKLLKRDKTICVVGAIGPLLPENNQERVMHRKSVSGSLIGSIAETQEVLDFCAKHEVAPEVQLIPIHEINHAFKKVNSSEVRFRYVIDMASMKDVDFD